MGEWIDVEFRTPDEEHRMESDLIWDRSRMVARRLHEVGIERTPTQVVQHYVDYMREQGWRIDAWILEAVLEAVLRDQICFDCLRLEMVQQTARW